ncbi:MAG: cytochrome P450 [Rubrimonas sp.]
MSAHARAHPPERDDAPFVDLADPTLSLRNPALAKARAESWYARTPYGIAVLRHHDMGQLLLHRSLRQGSYAWPAHNGIGGPFAEWWSRSIISREGADHSRLRRLVNPAFSPRLLDEMRPRFVSMARALAERFVPSGRCDFMADFADPYAAQVLCLMLGLPESDAPAVLRNAADMGLALGVAWKSHAATVDAATDAMFAFADRAIAERRARPRDDFMTALVKARDGAEGLSEAELRDMVVMLVMAGIDTTRNQLGLGMQLFLEHPDQWALLADKPGLASKAVEEVMRVRPTITWVTREAIEDFEYRGLSIRTGETLHLLSGVAATETTAEFDISAERPRHFGFGGGVHHCLGHAVARSDMAVALQVLPPLMRDPRADGPGEWLPDSGNTGPVRLPVAFG